MRPVVAGALYFASVFALGFVLGTIRVLWIVPLIGETTAVFIELPFMLLAAWVICGLIIRRGGVSSALGARAIMGAGALILLLAAEWALSLMVFGRTVAETAAHYGEAPGALGLAGQVLFGIFPLIRGRNSV